MPLRLWVRPLGFGEISEVFFSAMATAPAPTKRRNERTASPAPKKKAVEVRRQCCYTTWKGSMASHSH